jgi:hypothetical protein
MKIKKWVESVPKDGNTEKENEDTFYATQHEEGLDVLRYALSDGASESAFADVWSEQLVLHFNSFSLENTYIQATKAWENRVTGQDVPWFLQHKLLQGAHATFLGVEIDLKSNILRAVAVGDTNLILIRNRKHKLVFPLKLASEFNNQPDLLSSVATHQRPMLEIKRECKLPISVGDIVIMATDALAYWLLNTPSRKPKRWKEFELLSKSLNGKEDFERWLSAKRKNKEIKNDDTTFIFIRICDDLS